MADRIIVTWLWVLAWAQLGVNLGDSPGLRAEEREQLERSLEEAVVEVTGQPLGGPEHAQLKAEAIGVSRRIRVQLQRITPGAEPSLEVEVDLSRHEPETWRAQLVQVISTHWPPEPEAVAPPTPTPPPPPTLAPTPPDVAEAVTGAGPPPAEASLLPWVGVGATTLLAGGAIVAGLINRGQVTQGEASRDPAEVDRLQDQVFASGLTANVLFGAAAVAAGLTVVAFVSERTP